MQKRPSSIPKNSIQRRLEEEIDPFIEKGIYQDILGIWSGIIHCAETESFNKLTKLLHYKEFYEQKGKESLEEMREDGTQEEINEFKEFNAQKIAYIMELSDSKQIETYNSLVDKFNSQLDEIISNQDLHTIDIFYKTIKKDFLKDKIKRTIAQKRINQKMLSNIILNFSTDLTVFAKQQ